MKVPAVQKAARAAAETGQEESRREEGDGSPRGSSATVLAAKNQKSSIMARVIEACAGTGGVRDAIFSCCPNRHRTLKWFATLTQN